MKLFWKIFIPLILVLIVVFGLRFFSGDEDAWLCQNGEWIKHGQPSAPRPTSGCVDLKQPDEVIVTMPKLNQVVNNPLIVEGHAKGNFFFLSHFPL